MGRDKRLGPGEAGADGRAACVCCGRRVRVRRGAHDYGMIRGVCLACRASMRRLVNKGQTTWRELEANGLILPVDTNGEKQAVIMERLRRPEVPAERPDDPCDGKAKTAVLALLVMMRRRTRKDDDRAAIDRLAEAIRNVK